MLMTINSGKPEMEMMSDKHNIDPCPISLSF